MKIKKNVNARHGSCNFCHNRNSETITEISGPGNSLKARLCNNCLNKIHKIVKEYFSQLEKDAIRSALINMRSERPQYHADFVMNIIQKVNCL